MSNLSDEFIYFENARVFRGERCVFGNLNLHIRVGERVAVIGPNGSGKSTLLKAINRDIYPASDNAGVARIFGHESSNVWRLRERIGCVSDEIERKYSTQTSVIDTVKSGFFASVGVHGTLAERLTASHLEKALKELRSVDLLDVQHRTLSELSSGERRRCFLARAVVHSPEALILDEPTSGLDFKARFKMLQSIESLQTKTLLFVTHHLNDIPQTVDRIILLSNGCIVADGSKRMTLNSKLLSETYGIPIEVVEADGHLFVRPGSTRRRSM